MARRLSGGEKALIAVVAVLVLVFVGLLIDRLGGGAGSPDDGATTAGASATPSGSTTAVPGDVVDLTGVAWTFRMPSGNIGCAMEEDGVVCAIAVFDYPPPALDGCEGETGAAFRLDARGTAPLCTTGTVEVDDAPELAYGESRTVGEFICTSSETGVSCRNAVGHEMTLRRGSYGL